MERTKRRTFACKECGKIFESYQDRKYCSCYCFYKGLVKPVEKRKCRFCGKEFIVPKTRKSQKCCSQSCAAKYGGNVRKQEGDTLIEIKCKECGKIFIRERWKKQKFCSVQCGIDFHKGITLELKICPQCKKEFKREPWKKQKFCSVLCGAKFNKRNVRFRRCKCSNKAKKYREERIKKNGKRISLHRYLMEEKIGRELLREETVHHIDMNRKNNKIENLYLYKNESEHIKAHHLEKLISWLLERGIIIFKDGIYKRGRGGGRNR